MLVTQTKGRQPQAQLALQAAVGRAQGEHTALQLRQRRRRGVRGEWQARTEAAALVLDRLHLQFAMHGFAQATGQGQAEAGAAVLACNAGCRLDEGLEDALHGIFSNTNPRVAELDFHLAAVSAQLQSDLALTGELEGVGQQVVDDLPDPGRVAQQLGWQLRADQATELHAAGCILREQGGALFSQAGQVKGNTFKLQLAGFELGEVEDVVEQVHQDLARLASHIQLFTLLIIERAVTGQGDHAQQAVERGADLVAHVGQERRTQLCGMQGLLAGLIKVGVGLQQAVIGGLEFGRARRDDIFQLAQVFGQAVFSFATLIDFLADAFQLVVGDVHQYADLIFLMAAGAGNRSVSAFPFALAEGVDQADQRFGQGVVEQHQEQGGEEQAAHEARDHGQGGAVKEGGAVGVGVDLNAQHPEWLVGCVADKERIFEESAVAKQEVAEYAVAALDARPADRCQGSARAVDDLGADYRGGLQQTQQQFLRQFAVDVVGNTRGRVVADLLQGMDFAIDRGIFVGIIDADLNEAQQCSENECHYNSQACLLVGQTIA